MKLPMDSALVLDRLDWDVYLNIINQNKQGREKVISGFVEESIEVTYQVMPQVMEQVIEQANHIGLIMKVVWPYLTLGVLMGYVTYRDFRI